METNTRYLKISGARIEIPEDMALGTYDVEVVVRGDIVKEERLDQQDGTFDAVFVLKATEAIINK